jgi:hypothetical protein
VDCKSGVALATRFGADNSKTESSRGDFWRILTVSLLQHRSIAALWTSVKTTKRTSPKRAVACVTSRSTT